MISIADQQTTPKDQQSVEDRREKIYEMHLKGSNEREIAEAVGVNQSTVSRSLEIMGERNREWFRLHWNEGSYQGILLKEQRDRLMALVREAWTLYRKVDDADVGKKIQAFGLVKSSTKDLGEMLGLKLPSLSNPENFDPPDQLDDEKETIEVDLSEEKAPE